MLGFLAALQFLTILPIRRGFTNEQIGQATAYFPIVGLIIGLVLAGINFVLSGLLPSAVVNIFLIVALAVFSGALHLDGLADTFDGMAGHRTAEERLKIMKDSRIGGFGAVGLALFLLIEFVVLNSIPANIKDVYRNSGPDFESLGNGQFHLCLPLCQAFRIGNFI